MQCPRMEEDHLREVSADHYCSIHCTFCTCICIMYGSGRDMMLASGDLLFMCGVTKQKYQMRSR